MKFIKNNLLLIIVNVSVSTEAFVGTVCLITVRRSHIYNNLFAPKLSGERRLDRPFR